MASYMVYDVVEDPNPANQGIGEGEGSSFSVAR